MSLPRNGSPVDEVLARVDELQRGDVDWRGGRAFSLVYEADDEIRRLNEAVTARFFPTNALNPLAFPSLGRMQADVVAIVADLLHGGPEAAGFMTSGGTESILLAVKAARNRARVERPNVVLPTSAHAAFTKAGSYFGVETRRVPVRGDYRADVDAMADAVDDDTVLVVASAPQYPQGVIDPVNDVAALARDRDVLCHVDACMGGMILPFLARLGHDVPPFDFAVDGVTSISVDLHKYGYAAKGASVLVHRSKDLRRHQTFVTDDWLGGRYGSSGILGTRSGAPIAAAWATLHHLGEEGYLRLAGDARRGSAALVAGLTAVPGVRIVGDPEVTLVAFTFDDGTDPFAVGNALWQRGWYCDQQGPPPSLHCMVHAGHVDVVDDFVRAVAECADEVRAAASAPTDAAPYAAME
jgi:glutamate/tyrosine decarboxylase-like PLP-dependent enzyme